MNKILSVSIAAYNVEKYLKRAIDSLISSNTETLNELEVIVVNDGSSDSTLRIAQEYRMLFPEIVKIIDKKNGGYGSTINFGISEASGKYFKQLDGDDWYITNNISQYIKFLEDCTSDLVITPYYKWYEGIEKEEYISNHSYISERACNLDTVLFKENIQMHELTIRTQLLKEHDIRISEKTFYTDNEYTFMPLLYAKTICYFDKPIYVYRLGRDGQSVSLEGAKRHYKDTKTVAIKMVECFNFSSFKNMTSIMEIKYKSIIDSVFMYYLCSGDGGAKKELMEFDVWLKNNNKTLYLLSNEIKKVRLLRISHFRLFNFLSFKYIKEWK